MENSKVKRVTQLTYEDIKKLASCKNRTNFLHLPLTVKLVYYKVSMLDGGETFRAAMFSRYMVELKKELTSSVLERTVDI